MKHWLMIQTFTALNTMCRRTLGKQTTYRSLEGTEKANKDKHRITKQNSRAHKNSDKEPSTFEKVSRARRKDQTKS